MKQELTFEAEPLRGYTEFDEFRPVDPELFEAETSFEWMGEVNRSSADYVRWTQQSLNSVMGLRLAVDGIMGPQTRSAVRSFQQRAGLVIDGVVGPKTEGALISAGAPPFGGSSMSGGGATCNIVPVSLPSKQVLARPGARICCILAPTVIPFDPISNIADPASLGPHRTPGEATGIIYTGKAGFLDLGHMRDLCDITKFVFDQMMAAGGAPAVVITAHGGASFHRCPADVIKVARAISLDDGLGHEIVSYDISSVGMHNSAFSPEDLCSNFLGTLLAERAIAAGGIFNSAVDSALSTLLRSLDAQSVAETLRAFNLINGRWVRFSSPVSLMSNQYLQRRNFSQVPFKAGHPSDRPTPSFVTTLLPNFSSIYSYTHVEEGRTVPRSRYAAAIARIKVDAARRYGPNFDRP